ncbi:hypothetical protein DACRYDRAFT_101988 [Dacryopinax primogenitus]|uniref:Zn(2)-C6 fungal-type domain-containing protein n=1 Tax=Dacryopinax primogenitus (strain DJM 731) TaxID=1858805 RepID=M5FX53_DACPD|nr:uncharacterized protein DACRYDRAFT_101988 [Dacryopinax primogenitus]EJT98056.1 hypothetical protein DACRYDRAFT_101988 [Dacryopinax primogenitus]
MAVSKGKSAAAAAAAAAAATANGSATQGTNAGRHVPHVKKACERCRRNKSKCDGKSAAAAAAAAAAATANGSATQGTNAGRHVPHVKKACERCRRNKSKCDGVPGSTCRSCAQVGYECVWTQEKDARRAFTRAYVRALNDRIRFLEDLLRQNGIQFDGSSELAGVSTTAPASGKESPTPSEGGDASTKSEDPDELVLQLEHQLVLEKDPLVQGDLISFYGATSRFPAQYEILREASPPGGLGEYVSEELIQERKRLGRTPPPTWARNLPWDIRIDRTEHDKLVNLCFKYFTSWTVRVWPTLFWRDLEALSAQDEERAARGEELDPQRTAQYSPLLHNAILALATAWSDDPVLSSPEVRDKFARRAKVCIDIEASKPTLSTLHGLTILSSYYSGKGDQGLGWMYFGTAVRLSYAIGLDLDTSSWVENGPLTETDNLERDLSCASLVMQDKWWSLYVGRPSSLPPRQINLPEQLPAHLIRDPSNADEVAATTSLYDTFRCTWTLSQIAYRIMEDIYGPKPASSLRNVVSALHLALTNWHDKLPNSLRIPHVGTQSIPAQILSMHLAYEWLTILLLRPFYRRIASARPEDTSVLLCNRAAHQIVRLYGLWRRYHDLRYVPITAVQIAFTAGTTHLLAATYANGVVGKEKGLDGEMGQSWQSAIQSSRTLEKMMEDYAGRRESDKAASPVYLGPSGKYPGTGGFQVQLSPLISGAGQELQLETESNAPDEDDMIDEDDPDQREETPMVAEHEHFHYRSAPTPLSLSEAILAAPRGTMSFPSTPVEMDPAGVIWGHNVHSPSLSAYFQTLASGSGHMPMQPIFASGQMYPQPGIEWQATAHAQACNPFSPQAMYENHPVGASYDDLMFGN